MAEIGTSRAERLIPLLRDRVTILRLALPRPEVRLADPLRYVRWHNPPPLAPGDLRPELLILPLLARRRMLPQTPQVSRRWLQTERRFRLSLVRLYRGAPRVSEEEVREEGPVWAFLEACFESTNAIDGPKTHLAI